jgi:hypothetical protein
LLTSACIPIAFDMCQCEPFRLFLHPLPVPVSSPRPCSCSCSCSCPLCVCGIAHGGIVQWSEIRELTHRARRRKMLQGKDTKAEALKAVMGNDARTQSLSQI